MLQVLYRSCLNSHFKGIYEKLFFDKPPIVSRYWLPILFTIWEKRNNVTKKINKKEICPHLKFGNELNNTKVRDYQVVQAVLYRLKSGCQWRELPMKQFFRTQYKWQSVYYDFQKWCKDGSWEMMWQAVLKKHYYQGFSNFRQAWR